VIDRQHDLFGAQVELHGHVLNGIDRGPVHVRLTRLAQAAIAHGHAKAVEQTLERRRTAVHG
jgi:hypothetical protein